MIMLNYLTLKSMFRQHSKALSRSSVLADFLAPGNSGGFFYFKVCSHSLLTYNPP